MGTLFFYEWKKIVNRKIFRICMCCAIFLIVFSVGLPMIGDYIVNGESVGSNYEEVQKDMAYQKELDGKTIDEILLIEMQEAYKKVSLDGKNYSLTEEYQSYARPYSAIFNYVRQTTGVSAAEVVNLDTNLEILKEKRLERQEIKWEEYHLLEKEKEFWREQEEQIENPVVFRYAEGYAILINIVYTVGIVTVFLIAICMSSIFPEEHARRMDQQILSARYGRKEVYWAKLCAGTIVSFGLAFVFTVTAFITTFVLYGAQGFKTAFQVIYAGSSCPISVGWAVIIIYTMVLCAGTFIGVLVMTLSENLHSSVGTLAIVIGMIVLPMFVSIPDEYRVLAQLWSYWPSDIFAVWSCFSPKTVEVLGIFLQGWQVAPLLYTIIGVIMVVVTEKVFVRYQVSGR